MFRAVAESECLKVAMSCFTRYMGLFAAIVGASSM